MELNNRTTSFFIFILSGEITISFEQYTNRSVLENEMFFLPKNNCFKWKAVTQTVLILTGYNATIFPCTSVRARILYKILALTLVHGKMVALYPVRINTVCVTAFHLKQLFLGRKNISFSNTDRLVYCSKLIVISPERIKIKKLVVLLFNSMHSPSFIIIY